MRYKAHGALEQADERIRELEEEVEELRIELIGALWDLMVQGDTQQLDGELTYGHFFRSDLEHAQERLVELGAAERVDDYWIKPKNRPRG